MAYIVVAYTAMARTAMAYTVAAYIVMACTAMAYVVMACTAMACVVMAYVVMACVVMACAVMARWAPLSTARGRASGCAGDPAMKTHVASGTSAIADGMVYRAGNRVCRYSK